MQHPLPRQYGKSYQKVVRHFEERTRLSQVAKQNEQTQPAATSALAVINVYRRALEPSATQPFAAPLWSFSSPF